VVFPHRFGDPRWAESKINFLFFSNIAILKFYDKLQPPFCKSLPKIFFSSAGPWISFFPPSIQGSDSSQGHLFALSSAKLRFPPAMAMAMSAVGCYTAAPAKSYRTRRSSTMAIAAIAPRGAHMPSALKTALLGQPLSLKSGARKASRVGRSSTSVRAAPTSAAADGRQTVVITGCSSGLGLAAAKQLARSGKWYVVMANRDWAKSEKVAKDAGMPDGSYEIIHLDLASLTSVRKFAEDLRKSLSAKGRTLDRFVANAAVYLPLLTEPKFTADGYEVAMQTNHLGHFLLIHLLLDDLKKGEDPKCVILGSVTGNSNTLAGKIPPQADLGNLAGFAQGFKAPVAMADAGKFESPKAYKDAKVCNMLTVRAMDKRFKDTGISFESLYPGCIAETQLFRNHNGFFRSVFPAFQKNITKGYVTEDEAGRRLMQVVSDPKYRKSNSYWSWKNEGELLVDSSLSSATQSEQVMSDKLADDVYDYSVKLVGL